MLNRNKNILREAQSHYHASIPSDEYRQRKLLPDDSYSWGPARERFRKEINNYKNLKDAIRFGFMNTGYDNRVLMDPLAKIFPSIFSHYIPTRLLKYIAPEILRVHFFEDLLTSAFPNQIDTINLLSDNKFATLGTTLKKNGRYLSRELFYHANAMFTCMSYGNYSTICEIGVGNGALANIWMNSLKNKPDKYILVDVPETLFYAEILLALSNEGLNIDYISENDNSAEKSDGDIVLCPAHLVHMLDDISIDLIVSKACLNEISVDWVIYYQKFIAKHPEAVFYSLINNGPRDSGCSPIAPLLPDKWIVDYVRVDSPINIARTDSPVVERISKKNNSVDVNTLDFSRRLSRHEFHLYMYDYLRTDKIEDIYKFSVKAFQDIPYPPHELACFFSKIIYLEKDCEPRYSPEAKKLLLKIMNTHKNISEESINKILCL